MPGPHCGEALVAYAPGETDGHVHHPSLHQTTAKPTQTVARQRLSEARTSPIPPRLSAGGD
ncbi:hypothetical protein GCM10022224_097990 [Nonomuraea antimicrobica]|uniref:Uncharacterized protein n=1 Tax=Nonomuraea antimicrobica TaxID=561173 RepID=A0ABP7EAZ7_9ACTN